MSQSERRSLLAARDVLVTSDDAVLDELEAATGTALMQGRMMNATVQSQTSVISEVSRRTEAAKREIEENARLLALLNDSGSGGYSYCTLYTIIAAESASLLLLIYVNMLV